jgi:hypothetical protein
MNFTGFRGHVGQVEFFVFIKSIRGRRACTADIDFFKLCPNDAK